jgi:hypothetical protein
VLWLTGSTYHVPLSVAANAGWWITQSFRAQLHGFGQRRVFDLLVAICVSRHSLDEIRGVRSFESL